MLFPTPEVASPLNREDYKERLNELTDHGILIFVFLSSVLRSKVDIDIIQIVRLRGP